MQSKLMNLNSGHFMLAVNSSKVSTNYAHSIPSLRILSEDVKGVFHQTFYVYKCEYQDSAEYLHTDIAVCSSM